MRATRLNAAANSAAQRALLSAGGPGAGTVWAAMPGDRLAALDDEHWLCAARAKLGILRRPEGAGFAGSRQRRAAARAASYWTRTCITPSSVMRAPSTSARTRPW